MSLDLLTISAIIVIAIEALAVIFLYIKSDHSDQHNH